MSGGSVRVTVENKEAGTNNVVNVQDYYPYGEIISERYSAASNYSTRELFTEKERDIESSYDYFGARYYSNKLGVWLQVDPMADKYAAFSTYNYTINNPMKFIDTHGDSIDTSCLTKEQLKLYNDMIKKLSQSENFTNVYSTLQSSKSIYKIEIGTISDERAAAKYTPISSEVGSGG